VVRLKRRAELRELEELLQGRAAVAAVGSGRGAAVVVTYTEDAREELRGLVAVLAAVAAKLARGGVPAQFIVEIARRGARLKGDVVEVSAPPR